MQARLIVIGSIVIFSPCIIRGFMVYISSHATVNVSNIPKIQGTRAPGRQGSNKHLSHRGNEKSSLLLRTYVESKVESTV